MRLKNVARHFIALLSTFFLSIFGSLIIWTAIFSFSIQGTTAVIMSGSMEPGVSPGDVVISQEMSREDLANKIKPGHVLVFKDPSNEEQLITHRVNEKVVDETGSLEHFITKGDANRTADSTPVEPDNVAGVARILIPAIGLPIQGLKTGNFIPAIALFVLVSVAFISAREEFHRVRSANPKKESHKQDHHGKHVKIPVPSTKGKYVSNSVTLLAIVAIIASSSIVMSSSEAAFASSTANTGCTFSTAPAFGTTEPAPTDPYGYVKGSNASTYCWNDTSMPSETNLNVPLSNAATGAHMMDVSFISTYDSNKFGFNWKATFPTSQATNLGETFRMTVTDVNNQSVVVNKALNSRSISGYIGIWTGSNVTVKIEKFKSTGSLIASGTIIIKHCNPPETNSIGPFPSRFCSTVPNVNRTFAVTLEDASGAGRFPITIPVALTYTNGNIAYTATFPTGTTTTGFTMAATNAANTTVNSTATYTAPKGNGNIAISNSGSQIVYKLNSTAGARNRSTPDWTGTFTIHICPPTT